MDWNEFGNVHEETGWNCLILTYIWTRYCGPHTPIATPLDLYRYFFLLQCTHCSIYVYIHMYPTQRQLGLVLKCSNWYFSVRLREQIRYLAETMNGMHFLLLIDFYLEIFWDDRFHPYNHAPHFPYFVTGMVDSLPIQVSEPDDSILGSLLFNGKYKMCIFKVFCSFRMF